MGEKLQGTISWGAGGLTVGEATDGVEFHVSELESDGQPQAKGGFEYTFTMEAKCDAVRRLVEAWRERDRRRRKRLLWAVTHGCTASFRVYLPDGSECMMEASTPRAVRRLLARLPFVPAFVVCDKQGQAVRLRRKGRNKWQTKPRQTV